MGAWGLGLYSSDFAQDLRGAIQAVARLPSEPDRLLELLCETERQAANDPADADHTVFWLVVADQFAKRGIDCAKARDRARAIISEGLDLAAMSSLGMDEKSLGKRRAMLANLESQIATAPPSKPRAVLKAPQKLLLEVGEAVAYPICNGDAINPYTVGKEWAWVKAWKQDGWGAFVVVERGLAFEFLAWYRPLVVAEPLSERPTLAQLGAPRMWLLRSPGTLTARHAKNMQFDSVGRISIDSEKLDRAFPRRGPPTFCVVSDISIANNIKVRAFDAHEAQRVRMGRAQPPIEALSEIAA